MRGASLHHLHIPYPKLPRGKPIEGICQGVDGLYHVMPVEISRWLKLWEWIAQYLKLSVSRLWFDIQPISTQLENQLKLWIYHMRWSSELRNWSFPKFCLNPWQGGISNDICPFIQAFISFLSMFGAICWWIFWPSKPLHSALQTTSMMAFWKQLYTNLNFCKSPIWRMPQLSRINLFFKGWTQKKPCDNHQQHGIRISRVSAHPGLICALAASNSPCTLWSTSVPHESCDSTFFQDGEVHIFSTFLPGVQSVGAMSDFCCYHKWKDHFQRDQGCFLSTVHCHGRKNTERVIRDGTSIAIH